MAFLRLPCIQSTHWPLSIPRTFHLSLEQVLVTATRIAAIALIALPRPACLFFWGLQLTLFPTIKWHFQTTTFVIISHLINNFRIPPLSLECFTSTIKASNDLISARFPGICTNFPHKFLFLGRVLYRQSAEQSILCSRLLPLAHDVLKPSTICLSPFTYKH